MEHLPSRRQETALTTTSQQPWAIAIRESYGNLPAFAERFAPKSQKFCARNMVKAVEQNLPTFGRIVATYGEEGIAAVVATHITDAILRMGEDRDVDPYDVQFIAEAIAESERFRTLKFTTVLGFFHLLKCGEFDIYGKVTPRKILEALRKYAIEAQAKENRIYYEMEKERERREAEEHDRLVASQRNGWEDFKKRNNLDPNLTIAEYNLNMQKEAVAARKRAEEDAKPPIVRFLEAWREFGKVLSFVEEYLRIKRKAK